MTDRDRSGALAGHRVWLDPAGQGGESVCWLPRVCRECGRLAEAGPPTWCPRCGAEIGTDIAEVSR